MPRTPTSQDGWTSPWEEHLVTIRPDYSAYEINVWYLPNTDYRDEYGTVIDHYWQVRLRGQPVNGGLCSGVQAGKNRAENAIHGHEWGSFREQHYWDVESGRWYRRGELPPVE